MEHLVVIPKNKISPEQPLFVALNKEPSFIVIQENNTYKVIKNLCVHMGGFFSANNYCTKEKKLTCPWHAYEFSATDLSLKKNPSIEHWISKLTNEDSHFRKLRKMKLIELSFEETVKDLIVRLSRT
ncbi:MAG: Rieske (2Fe-2S) protein [Bdellovibrionales bacterium]|nr:Rieske (2Fe-2S) protein [Bdellovibrionales bacterium]